MNKNKRTFKQRQGMYYVRKNDVSAIADQWSNRDHPEFCV